MTSTEGKALLDIMASNSDVWAGWTYFSAGGRYQPAGYTYGIQPSGSVPNPPQVAILKAQL